MLEQMLLFPGMNTHKIMCLVGHCKFDVSILNIQTEKEVETSTLYPLKDINIANC